jgi:hypothetical protein
MATILNNPIFKRGPRDRLLLDYDFFFSFCTTPVLPLIVKINFTDLFVGNRFKTIGQLELLFNTTLDNEFFHLFRNAFNYFKISHRKELSSTETPISMSHFCTIKKPGKQFRLLLETIKNEKKLENLQNVKTFRNLTGLTWPENFCFKVILGGWSLNFFFFFKLFIRFNKYVINSGIHTTFILISFIRHIHSGFGNRHGIHMLACLRKTAE